MTKAQFNLLKTQINQLRAKIVVGDEVSVKETKIKSQ